LRLLDAGACTFVYYPVHGATPSDWARPLPDETQPPLDETRALSDQMRPLFSQMHYLIDTPKFLYAIFITYRLTGPVMMSGRFPDYVQIEKSMLAEAEATGLSAAALREIGNGHVRYKKWVDAAVAYSHALVVALKRPESADEKMEAAKAAINRSFVNLQMAKELVTADEAAMAIERNAKVMQLVADAKARGTGGMGEGLTPCPDLMDVLRGATLAEAAAEGRLERWRMLAIMAFFGRSSR
jgi:hypothetical protein